MRFERRGALGRHERRYLRRLRTLFVLFRRDERRRMLKLARTNLEDRPTSESWNGLVVELGRPEEYAGQLVRDEHALPQPAAWRRVVARFKAPWRAAAALTIVGALLAGGLSYRTWRTERPELIDNCFSIVQVDDGVPIQDSEAMGYREQRVSHVDGAELMISLCPSSSETIEVLDLRIPYLDEAWPAELVEVTMAPIWAQSPESLEPVPFAAYTLGGLGGEREHTPKVVTYRYRLGRCADALRPDSIGADLTVQRPEITYRFRGRTHTVQLDPPSRIFLSIDREHCPGATPLPELGAVDRPGDE
jgi:hypothetical protein